MKPPVSARVRRWRGAAAVTLAAGATEVTFLPELGMLGAALRHGGDDLLHLGQGLAGYRAGHQTALPLLAPWANRLDGLSYEIAGAAVDLRGQQLHTDANDLPIHGTMTARDGWEILAVEPAFLAARFDYAAHPDLLPAFPFPHTLTVEVRVDDGSVSVTTTLRATGGRAVPVSYGWHPYFRLPRVPRRRWHLTLPSCRHLDLDDRGLPTGRSTLQSAEQQPIGQRTFDDLYALDHDLAGDRTLAIEAGGQRLAVSCGEGYPFVQVFVPPDAGFACLEPMTAPTNALVTGQCPLVAPGDEHRSCFTIDVTRNATPTSQTAPS